MTQRESISGNIKGLAGVKVALINAETGETVDQRHSLHSGSWEFLRPGTGKYNVLFDGRNTIDDDDIYGIEIVDMSEFEATEQYINDTPPGGTFGNAGTPIAHVEKTLSAAITIQWTYTQHETNKAHGFVIRWEHGPASGQTVTTASPSRKLDSTVRKTVINVPPAHFVSFKIYAYFSAKGGTIEDAGYQYTNGTDWVDYQANANPVLDLYKDVNNFIDWDGNRLVVQAANFLLDASGKITAVDVDIEGNLTATSGSLVDLSIDGTLTIQAGGSLVAGGVTLSNAGLDAIGTSVSIILNDGTDSLWLSTTDPWLALGGSKRASAPFRVTKDGSLIAADGKAVFNADGSGMLGSDAISWTVDGLIALSPNVSIEWSSIVNASGGNILVKGAYLDFDGNDLVQVADDPNLDFGTGDFSVFAVVRPRTVNGTYRFILDKPQAGYPNMGLAIYTDNKFRFLYGTTVEGTSRAISNDVAEEGRIYALAGVADRDGNTVLYVDGVPQSFSDAGHAGDLSNSEPLNIGRGTTGYYYEGNIYKILIFNRVLTASEVENFCKGQPVLAADQGGSQLTLWDGPASIFTTGTYSWYAISNNTIANVDNTLESTYVDSQYGAAVFLRDSADLSTDLIPGCRYRIILDAKYSGGSTGSKIIIDANESEGGIDAITDELTTSMVPYILEFTAGTATGCRLLCIYMGANNKVYIDNIIMTKLGCVAEYNHSSIDAENSKLYDHSINNLHGTIVGATAINLDFVGGDGTSGFTHLDQYMVSSPTIIGGTVGGARVQLDSTGLKIYDASPTQRAELAVDGSGWFGSTTAFYWTAAGVLKAAGWTLKVNVIEASQARLYSSGVLSLGSANNWHTANCIYIDGVNSRLSIGTNFKYTGDVLTVGGWVTTPSAFEKFVGSQGVRLDATNRKITVGHLTGNRVEINGVVGEITLYEDDSEVVKVGYNIDASANAGVRIINGSLIIKRIDSYRFMARATVNDLFLFAKLPSNTGTDLVIDAFDQIFKKSSSRRYKENIRAIEVTPDLVYKLNPVSFNWKQSGIEDFGLIAEDVYGIIPEMVTLNSKGKPEAVKYDNLSVLNLMETKNLHARIVELETEVTALKQQLAMA